MSAMLHCCIAIITARTMSMDLDNRNRPNEHEKILEWTDKFGREPNGQKASEETASENPNDVNGKFKPVLTRDKDKDKSKNEVNNDGNHSVPSVMAHPPVTPPPDIGAALDNTIHGEKFCGGKLPESRLCDPHDILSANEGIVWVI